MTLSTNYSVILFARTLFTHGPLWEERGSTDGLFLLLLLLLLLSSSSSLSHFQLFVSLMYRKCQFSNWFDFPGNSSDSYLFLLLLLLFPGAFLSRELSTPVWKTVHRLQAVQWLLFLFSTIQPWGGYKTGLQIKASPGLDIKLAHYYCLRKTDIFWNLKKLDLTLSWP